MAKKGKINAGAATLQCLGMVFLLVSILMGNWLANPSGLNYYPYSRSWGLFTVSGRITQTLYEAWETQCRIAAKHGLDVACVTPLCKWYSSKCSAYRMQSAVSYSVAVALITIFPLTISAIIISMRSAKKAMKWVMAMSLYSVVIPLASICAYIGVMGASFDVINSGGYYPVPQPSVGLFMFGISYFFFLCGFIAHTCKAREAQKERNYEDEMYYEAARLRQNYGI